MSFNYSLQSTSSGVVPYLGTYLTVLTMLDTALPDTVEVRNITEEQFLCLMLDSVIFHWFC